MSQVHDVSWMMATPKRKRLEITIRPYGDGYQACVSVPRAFVAVKAPHILGEMTQDGPWIGGQGRTLQEAIDAMNKKLGEAFVAYYADCIDNQKELP